MCCDEEEDEGKSVSLPSPDRPHGKDHRVKTTAALPETHQPKVRSECSPGPGWVVDRGVCSGGRVVLVLLSSRLAWQLINEHIFNG